MIEIGCKCGARSRYLESFAGQTILCPGCGTRLDLLSAERLSEGSGVGDFDTRLVVVSGPRRLGEQFFLGGVNDLAIGESPEAHLFLPGQLISPIHCRLQRIGFGPSRWSLVDEGSGIAVNGQRVAHAEIRHGDRVDIGEYELRFERVPEASATTAVAPPLGKRCPACSITLTSNATICTHCGIDLKTGRPLVISREFDEEQFKERVNSTVTVVSYFVWTGLFPIASEAYAAKKPTATWVVFVVTLVISLVFLLSMKVSDLADQPSSGLLNLMHWTGDRGLATAQFDELVKQLQKHLETDPNFELRNDPALLEKLQETPRPPPEDVGFRWHQLFTHALLHDGLMHFSGNMLFLFVFGLRVNQLLGNLKFAIVYPVLAIGSGVINGLANQHDPMRATLGASGAIMGLAGMYLIFFPVQKVHTAIWLRWFLHPRHWIGTTFRLRGFWWLVLWIGFSDGLPMALGESDDVAHWAHIGGLIVGIALALGLLIARQAHAHGGDLISVILGKHAWALIGKPKAQAA